MSNAKNASSFTTSMSASINATPTTTQSRGMKGGELVSWVAGWLEGCHQLTSYPTHQLTSPQQVCPNSSEPHTFEPPRHDWTAGTFRRTPMTLTRRSGVALAIAGSVLTLAAATPRVFSPGYTYRMRITAQTTEPNGKTKDYIVMSGRAMVTSKAGRMDIDTASKERGAMADKGGYILYDPTTMMIVSPKDKQVLKFTFEDIEKGMGALAANMPGMRIAITDVAVDFEKLGPGEPLLGMSTTKYRITQDYKIAMKIAFMNRNSTEHIVQDYWMTDQKSGFANPFARVGSMRPVGGGAFAELMTKSAEATAKMGKGIPVKTLTTTTSTSDKGEKTTSVTTMEVT